MNGSCLSVTIGRVGGIEATAVRKGGGIEARTTRIRDFAVSVGLVCNTNLDELGIIWASDGKLITLEGGYLIGA